MNDSMPARSSVQYGFCVLGWLVSIYAKVEANKLHRASQSTQKRYSTRHWLAGRIILSSAMKTCIQIFVWKNRCRGLFSTRHPEYVEICGTEKDTNLNSIRFRTVCLYMSSEVKSWKIIMYSWIYIITGQQCELWALYLLMSYSLKDP